MFFDQIDYFVHSLVQKLPSGKWVVVGIVSGGLRVEDDLLHSDFVSTAGHLKWINSIILQ